MPRPDYRGNLCNKIRIHRILILLAPAVVAVWVIGLPFQQPDHSRIAAEPDATFVADAATPTASNAASTLPVFVTGLENLPAYLQDTAVEDNLRADDNGHLIVDVAVRNLFDYFLSLNGRESQDNIVQRIRAYLQYHLPATAAEEGEQLLQQYLAYQTELSDIQSAQLQPGTQPDLALIRTQMALDLAARQRHFSPTEADAFFQDEDAYNADMLARLEIVTNTEMDAHTKTQQLAQLDNALPDDQQRTRNDAIRLQQVMVLTSTSSGDITSENDLQSQLITLAGPEAAERLQQLARERQAWDARVQSWLQERARLLDQSGLAQADAHAMLEAQRNERFDPAERLRVVAAESVQNQPAR